MPAFSLAVYCGSRSGIHPAYTEAAEQVGRWIGEHRGRLVYGGGNNGLMGVVASAVLDSGGEVLGVIPRALVNLEVAKTDCTELVIVDTMHERKAIMAAQADAFLSLPGGIGTLEEMFETWVWRQLGYHNKPMGLLNVAGCYDALLGFLNQSVNNGFMGSAQQSLMTVDSDAKRLLQELMNQAGFGTTQPTLAQIA